MGTEEAVRVHDDLLAHMPDGARHDADICPICVDKATQSSPTTSRIPPASGGPDVSTSMQSPTRPEGGTPKTMSESETMNRETHEALLDKAIKDATSATEAALERKTTEAEELNTRVTTLESENAELRADNERLNSELDTAQVNLKSATDEVAQLKTDIAAKEEQARKSEVASKRVEQVRNLGLFADDYVTEKAEAWAGMSDEAWSERLDEWQRLKPAKPEGAGKNETASAMTGTTETFTRDQDEAAKKTPARRLALGLS